MRHNIFQAIINLHDVTLWVFLAICKGTTHGVDHKDFHQRPPAQDCIEDFRPRPSAQDPSLDRKKDFNPWGSQDLD